MCEAVQLAQSGKIENIQKIKGGRKERWKGRREKEGRGSIERKLKRASSPNTN